MTTNPYFNSNYFGDPEKQLTESLTVESIQIHGIDVKYLPRTLVAFDELLGEDVISRFDTAYEIEMYLKSFESWGGDGDFLSKFGLEIRDEVTLQVSISRFAEEVTALNAAVVRPREGDLIYFPFSKRVFEIKFVEHEEVFYQVGKLFTYELRCKLFEYNSEDFETGDNNIDRIESRQPTTLLELVVGGDGEFEVGERVQQTTIDDFVVASAIVVSWDSPNLVVKETVGQFVPGAGNITGEISLADWAFEEVGFQQRNYNEPDSVNNLVNDIADELIVETKPNRLGG